MISPEVKAKIDLTLTIISCITYDDRKLKEDNFHQVNILYMSTLKVHVQFKRVHVKTYYKNRFDFH